MRLNWKFLWLAMPIMLGLLGAGCSGINAGGSVSPGMFFVPKADSPPATAPAPVAEAAPPVQLAQAR